MTLLMEEYFYQKIFLIYKNKFQRELNKKYNLNLVI